METGERRLISLAVRLTDVADGRVAFARTFERVRDDGDARPARKRSCARSSAALAQPYGIIQARERARDGLGGAAIRAIAA